MRTGVMTTALTVMGVSGGRIVLLIPAEQADSVSEAQTTRAQRILSSKLESRAGRSIGQKASRLGIGTKKMSAGLFSIPPIDHAPGSLAAATDLVSGGRQKGRHSPTEYHGDRGQARPEMSGPNSLKYGLF
jgi:hypothetical protein